MKVTKKVLCILLALFMLLPLAACSDGTVTVATYKDTSVDSGMLSYMISSQKAYLEQMLYYYYGITDFDSTWAMEIGTDENGNVITFGDNAMESIISSLKMFVIVKQLCKEYGLTITDQSVIDEIEDYIAEDIELAGDENYLEIALSEYGARIKDERDYLYTTSLTSVLLEYLFGDSGSMKIADADVRTEFESAYTKVDMHMFSYTEKNDSGSYVDRSDASITDEELKASFDNSYLKAEQILFYFYDLSDSTGSTKISDAEQQEKREKANELYEKLKNGEIEFDEAKKTFDEDPGMFTESDGDVLAKGSLNEKFADFENALFATDIGDITLVETDIGVHIVLRKEMSESDFNAEKESIRKALTKEKIAASAVEFFEKIQNGTAKIDGETQYGTYQEAFLYAEGELGDDAEKLIAELKAGEYAVYSDTSCTVIFHRMALDDDDYTEYYDVVKDELSQNAFYDYIESLYSQVVLNEEEIAKFNFTAAKSLNISTFS